MTGVPHRDIRLPALRAVDAVIAALQSTFALDNLIDGHNPYRFIENDPARSPVWICHAEARQQGDRAGNAKFITVSRGEYVPQDLHMLGNAGSNFSDTFEYSDLADTLVLINCEGASAIESETLASISYSILKMYRIDLQREFELHNLTPVSIGTPSRIPTAVGAPYVTTVAIKIQTQERFTLREIANQLNHVDIVQRASRLSTQTRLDMDLETATGQEMPPAGEA